VCVEVENVAERIVEAGVVDEMIAAAASVSIAFTLAAPASAKAKRTANTESITLSLLVRLSSRLPTGELEPQQYGTC